MASGKIVGFSALPSGWRNVYDEDGKRVYYPCPGVLLFEDGDYPKFADKDGANLTPADDVNNYVETLAPGQE